MSELLQPSQLYDYQRAAIQHQTSKPDTMLWLGMGLGKTVITLTTIVDRMRAGIVKKTLIFGPIRVVKAVWHREARKWEHTKHLRFSVIHGSVVERKKALFADSDVYLINYENMNWLAEQLVEYYINQGDELPFDMVVYDEISKLKNSTSKRMKGGKSERMRKGHPYTVKLTGWTKIIPHLKFRTGLTGTPAPNGYRDLHGQYLAVDGGERLSKSKTYFEDNYFIAGYMGWNKVPTDLGKEAIENLISDITIKMDTKDYVDLPDVKKVHMLVDLPLKVRRKYDEVEKNMFTELDSGTEIELPNRASVVNKCLQFANGSPYIDSESEEFEKLHDEKLKALESVIEEAAGQPVLCSYTFKSDAKRIMNRFNKTHFRVVNLTEEPSSKTESIVDEWNAGKIKLLIGHPASMGHGIDGLQDNGSILVWFGLNWSLELYEQMNARLHRTGQKSMVTMIQILCRDTVDLAVADALDRKSDDQEGLKKSLDRYRNGHVTNELNEINFM